MSTGGVGVAVSPEEIATGIVAPFAVLGYVGASDDLRTAIATALRAAEARGREEAARLAECFAANDDETGAIGYATRHRTETIASAIRSLNAPQSPGDQE